MYRWAKKGWFNDFGAYAHTAEHPEARARELATAAAAETLGG
jgi:hypothetical protein